MSEIFKTKSEIKEEKSKLASSLIDLFIPNNTIKKDQFEKWFSGYIKNYVYEKEIDINSSNFITPFRHIIDYLASPQSKPRFDRMIWSEALRQSQDWQKWLNSRVIDGDDPENIELVDLLSDDWRVVDLLSEKALQYEGGAMQHCVGGYWSKVASGNAALLSLRDKNDLPHATIEVDLNSNSIIQIRGKQNKPPIDKHKKYLFEYLQKAEYIVRDHELKELNCWVLGRTYNLQPKNQKQKESIIKSFLKNDENRRMGGDLDLSGIMGIKSIDGNWRSLNLIGSGVEVIQEGAVVEEVKFNRYSAISLIGKNTSIGYLNEVDSAFRGDLNTAKEFLAQKESCKKITFDSNIFINSIKIISRDLAFPELSETLISDTTISGSAKISGDVLFSKIMLKGMNSKDLEGLLSDHTKIQSLAIADSKIKTLSVLNAVCLGIKDSITISGLMTNSKDSLVFNTPLNKLVLNDINCPIEVSNQKNSESIIKLQNCNIKKLENIDIKRLFISSDSVLDSYRNISAVTMQTYNHIDFSSQVKKPKMVRIPISSRKR